MTLDTRQRRILAQRDRVTELKAACICIHCGKNPVEHGGPFKCETCRTARKRKFQTGEYISAEARRHAAGLCTGCGGIPRPGRKSCELCAAHERERSRKRVAKARDTNFCVNCRVRPAEDGVARCKECADRRREKVQTGEWRNSTPSSRRRLKELRAAGLCLFCGKLPAGPKNRSYCEECRLRSNEIKRRSNRRIRDTTFAAYGGYMCRCCGETNEAFLQLDHINNDGAKHRKENGSGNKFYKWLRMNNYPADLQPLCANCNYAKSLRGECPHQKQYREVLGSLVKESA